VPPIQQQPAFFAGARAAELSGVIRMVSDAAGAAGAASAAGAAAAAALFWVW
jgi:hypothetical protein